jgi:hypothetical protein
MGNRKRNGFAPTRQLAKKERNVKRFWAVAFEEVDHKAGFETLINWNAVTGPGRKY